MSTHLYRTVTTVPIHVSHNGEDSIVEPAGFIIGRRSGYLSRSSAVDAARKALLEPGEFEILKSEPIVFLTQREKEAKRADELEAEAKRIRAGIETESSLFPDPFDVTTIAGSVRVWTANPLQYLTADEAREAARLLRVAAGALDVEDQ